MCEEQWWLSAWQSLQRVGREEGTSPNTACFKKGWPQPWSKWLLSWSRVKWGSQDCINLLFPNQLLQWDYHKHDGLDHLIQLDGSSGGWVNKGARNCVASTDPEQQPVKLSTPFLTCSLGLTGLTKHMKTTQGVCHCWQSICHQNEKVGNSTSGYFFLTLFAPLKANKRFLIHKNNNKEEKR